jgi:XRE family aerobic/anaerobic benzoate catabolism transcriptional regulator
MEESRAVGKRIEALRRKKGLTQEKLAEQVGLSMKHIGEIERGRVNPTLAP